MPLQIVTVAFIPILPFLSNVFKLGIVILVAYHILPSQPVLLPHPHAPTKKEKKRNDMRLTFKSL